MPLYRTNSDRGLWKKYREPQPQHFHKPNYLELDKPKPQVTYSQLQLGENYRSYNNRQSHPNLRAIESVNGGGESVNGETGTGDRWSTRRRRGRSFSTTKSAPATPRATTPTRSYNKYRMNGDDFKYEDVIRAPSTHSSYVPQNSTHYNPRPNLGGDSLYTTPTGYADSESGYSLESRSLAAYSGASSTHGRDPSSGYRYPYATEPIRQSYGRVGYMAEPQEPDRPNPFAGPLSPDADSVVQMFLMNQTANRGQQQQQQQQQRSLFITGLNATSPGNPGRIEDLPSPIGPINPGYNNGQHNTASSKVDDDEDDNKGSYYTRTVIQQLRKDFLSGSPPKPVEQQPPPPSSPEKKTNKYLKTENRWTGPPIPHGTNGVLEDTVQTFQAPQIHHAEVVTLRQDTSSESDEDMSMEPPSHMVLQSPMVPMPKSVTSPQSNQQPLSLYEQQQQQFLFEQQQLEKKFKEEQEQLRREQEQLIKQQEQLFLQQQQQYLQQKQFEQQQQYHPQQQQYHPQKQQQQQQYHPQHQQQQYNPQQQQQHSLPRQVQPPVRHLKNNSGLDRSFEDPAYANFQSMGEDAAAISSPSTPPSQEFGSPGKKKGFFSSFFKKPSPSSSSSAAKKGRGGKGKRPRSEYVPEDENQQFEDDQTVPEIPKSHTDGDLHLHVMERSPLRLSPVVPQPGTSPMTLNVSGMSNMHKNASMITHPGMSFEQELEYDDDMGESFSDEQPQQPLQRKLSMSKPTDLDELMRLQEQEEQENQRQQDEELRRIQMEDERQMKLQMEEQKRIQQQLQLQQQQQEQKRIQQQLQLQQQQQQEERRRQQQIAAANAAKLRDPVPPLPARQQTVEEIFKNDPWFQNPDGSNGPIYQNTLAPVKLDLSLDTTTEEIDIDAVLGYPDIAEEPELELELDQPVIRQIEEIIWPKSEPELVEDNAEEGDFGSSPPEKSGGKKKSSFFSFGGDKNKKKKGKQRPETPPPPVEDLDEEEVEQVLAADHYDEDKSPKPYKAEGEKRKLWISKKAKPRPTSLSEEEEGGPESYSEDVKPKQKVEPERKKLWGSKKSKQKSVPQLEEEEPAYEPESFVEEVKQKPKPDTEKKKLWGTKKSKPQPVAQPMEEEFEAPEEYVEEVKQKQKPETEKKKLWGTKKSKPQPASPPAEEDFEAQEEYVEEVQQKQKPETEKKKLWGTKKSKPQPVDQPMEEELEAPEEYIEEVQQKSKPEFVKKKLWGTKKSKPQPVSQSEEDEEQEVVPAEKYEEDVQEQEAPQPDEELEQEQEGQVVDVMAEAVEDEFYPGEEEEEYEDKPVERKPPPPPPPKKGLSGIFHKPTWKAPSAAKKPSPQAKKPLKIGNVAAVDVSHLLDDNFGIEEAPESGEPQQTDTDADQEVGGHDMMSDESPNEVSPQKSKFKLKINLKKDKPVKEAKPDTRPKPAKFFKSPSFKSPASNKRTTPKTSPESKNVRTEDEDSPARDSSAERTHHYSPPKAELSVVQQVENLNLNDLNESDQERQHLDSYTEPAPIQTSEDDERRESTTADEGRYTTEETEGEEERLPEPVVSLPVEMEEPEPTEPIRGRPRTAKKKSGGSGLAGLFSSSRPSSRTRSGNKREPEIQEATELDDQPEPEQEEERPFDNRRPQAKGFGGLFASKRNKPQRPRPRPLSGPPAGIRQDEDEPQFQQEPEEPAPPMPLRKQRGPSFSNIFGSRRGPSTKSTGNLADRRREPEEEQPEEEEKPSYNNSTSSLSRAKREKGFGAMFGAPKTRMSGRKSMPRSTTFPLAPQQPQQQQHQQDEYEDEQPTPQQQQQPTRQQPKVQESPQLSESRSEDRRPPLPLPQEQVNQYSPTPKQQDSMVYDQIEIVNEPPLPRQEVQRPEPPRDPNRQVGRRSGRFRRPQDGANVSNLSANDSGSLNNSRQTSSSALPRPAADTTQSVMRDIFAETVVRKPVNVPASRSSHEESLAASGLGADFEYEKAIRGPKPETTRSRVMNKKTSNSNVGRTESYRQAHNSGPGPENERDKKMSNYNSLPRLGGSKQRRQQQQQPRQQQQQQQQEDGDNANFDTRSLGDRPRSRSTRTEDPCSVM